MRPIDTVGGYHPSRVLPTVALVLFGLLAGCGQNSTKALIDQLQDSDVAVRRAAARTLADLKHEASDAAPALRAALRDEDKEVRRLALHALSLAEPDDEDLEALKGALNDAELSVRLAAALAIDRIAPEEPSHRAVLISAMRKGEGGIIVQIGQAGESAAWAVPTLIELLEDERAGIRRITANALQAIGAPAAAASDVLQRVAQQDADDRVRDAAASALDSIAAAPRP